ncbi:MAG TPA: ADP-glyceromanno-heptose 6-epimerase [Bryobacteraceae bacterium]|nr:ADP-glyceromanno-heptose 6-epimerase [Bryobacteraceae bacterium]
MYIVTGGAGFIGSNLVAALSARQEEVVVCDWMGQDERWRNLVRHEIAGLIEPEKLPLFLEDRKKAVRAVVHMGAISATTERNIDLIAERNIRSTLQLIDWCTREDKPLIYASSAATYGDGAGGFDDDASPEALARLKPLNAYGWSKHVVDRHVARLKARGVKLPPQIVGLKFFNVYGPNEYHKGSMKSVIAQNYPRVAAGEPIRLFRSRNPNYADGGQLRDFIYVRDCVEAILWLLANPAISGLFNLGSGKARSWLDLAKALCRAAGKDDKISFIDMPAELADSYQYLTQARMEKLRAAGFTRPMTPLEEGVEDYVCNFLMRKDPYL